jgi:regulator of sigma E protease
LTILKVALGLGFVIFIHELGHFILAKWNGVKVEKFSIGFGPTLYGFRRGETEYVLAAFPLGGFVKMLGEGTEGEESKSTDPRAYPNKSVSARMAIISAGVIMNLVFAFASFVYYNRQERNELPAVLGAVSAGSPAYEAGLRAGDEIVAVDDHHALSYSDLQRQVLFSSHGEVLHFEVKRPGQERLVSLDIQPRREASADRPTIGILPSTSLKIADFQPPAGMTNPPSYSPLEGKERESKVDVLVAAAAAGEEPARLVDINEYDRLLANCAERPVTHVIERRRISAGETEPPLARFELTFPPNRYVEFGLRLAIEPISGVRKNSPADRAGFRKGDRIVKVKGRDDFDPMQLPSLCHDNAGRPVAFEVQREIGPGQRQIQTLTATPDDSPLKTRFALEDQAVDVPALGLCYPIRTQVVGVRPGSPAAKAGLSPGDTINALVIPPVQKPAAAQPSVSWFRRLFGWPKAERPKTFEFNGQPPGWLIAFAELQARPIQAVELLVNKASKPVKITPELDPNWYNPRRGLQFQLLIRKLPGQNLTSAMWSGYEETIQNILMVYATFRSLAERRVSPKNLGGPILIAQVAYDAAGSGLTQLIFFLGILSVNLAVLNFLPIPPLDGGQMVFLIAEKVRGRPLPDSALIAGTYFGLFLVLCLMVFVTYQDVFRLVESWFSS